MWWGFFVTDDSNPDWSCQKYKKDKNTFQVRSIGMVLIEDPRI